MEKYKKGGYTILDLESSTIYKDALNAVASNKPVVVYDLPDIYFADTIKTATIDDDLVVIITKGGKTITINDADVVISEGLVANPTMENIVDLNGNKRFIEGDITTEEVTGVTFNYAKWSLSGTHLMIVLGGNVADATTITHSTKLATINIPQFILDKIGVLWSSNGVDVKTINFIAYSTSIQTTNVMLTKETNKLEILKVTDFTSTAAEGFRIQFDLLIDAE